MRTRLNPAFFAALCIYILLLCPYRSAQADSPYALTSAEALALIGSGHTLYARPLEGGARLYTDAHATDWLFNLPHTFYAKITEVCGETFKVTYCYEDYDYARAVSGFVQADCVAITETPPTGKSFPTTFLRFEGNGAFYKNNRFDSLYSSADVTGGEPFFYGCYERADEQFCYVYLSGKLGYFSAEVFETLPTPTHHDPMPLPPPEESEGDVDDTDTGGFFSTDTNKVIFISVAAIIAVCAVYLLFLPRRAREEADPEG